MKYISLFCFLTFNVCFSSLMDVSEIEPGMRGIGKTVFNQTKIEEFQVEIIDVMKNVSPRGDIILARLSGGSIPGGLEKTGVIAGMSGSPVYINGKLIGALAYTWSFLKEPIAGITPIREILEIIDVDKQSKASPQNQQFKLTNSKNNFRHIPLPLAISSSALFSCPEFSTELDDFLSGYGLLPVFVGGIGSDSMPIELEPGAAIGTVLIQGDMRVAAIGTLTYRDGDKILGLGHPIFLGGKVELPLIAGVIHSVMPSQALSFKMFSPTRPIGMITQDRASGIMGKIGKTTPMVPIKVAIQSQETDTIYSYESIEHKNLLPILLNTIILNSIVARGNILGESTIKADMILKIKTDHRRVIKLSQMISGDASAIGIAVSLVDPIVRLINNEFEKVKIEDIAIRLDIENKKRTTFIEKLVADKEKVKPGDSLEITIGLRSFQGKFDTKKIKIQIPKETPVGRLALIVANADSTYLLELARTPERLTAKSFTQLIEQIEKLGRKNEMQISGYVPQKGVVVEAQELPNPPLFLKQVLTRPKKTVAITESSLILRHSLTFDEIIQGVVSLNLIVER